MAAYIATDAGYAGARDLVAAAGLITVGADGTISVSSFSGFFCCQIVLFPKKRNEAGKQGRKTAIFLLLFHLC